MLSEKEAKIAKEKELGIYKEKKVTALAGAFTSTLDYIDYLQHFLISHCTVLSKGNA